MREKYESLSLAVLKELAKARGLKGISTLRKSQLIEVMLEQDEKDKATEEQNAAAGSDTSSNSQDGIPQNSKEPVKRRGRKKKAADAGMTSPAAAGNEEKQKEAADKSLDGTDAKESQFSERALYENVDALSENENASAGDGPESDSSGWSDRLTEQSTERARKVPDEMGNSSAETGSALGDNSGNTSEAGRTEPRYYRNTRQSGSYEDQGRNIQRRRRMPDNTTRSSYDYNSQERRTYDRSRMRGDQGQTSDYRRSYGSQNGMSDNRRNYGNQNGSADYRRNYGNSYAGGDSRRSYGNSYAGGDNRRSYGDQNGTDNRKNYGDSYAGAETRRNYGDQNGTSDNRKSYGETYEADGRRNYGDQSGFPQNDHSYRDLNQAAESRLVYGDQNGTTQNRQPYSTQNEAEDDRQDYEIQNQATVNDASYNESNEEADIRVPYGGQGEMSGGYAEQNLVSENRKGYAEQSDSSIPDTSVASSQNTVDVDRPPAELSQLDSGQSVSGILEVMPDGYGFIRSDNYLPGENDVYVSPSQIRRFNLKTGDIISGNTRIKSQQEKFSALLYLKKINDLVPSEAMRRYNFEDMTPIFPNERLRLERDSRATAMRIVDLFSPLGKGQRGMIVSPPKAGKTTLLKDIARSLLANSPDMRILILLIDERPEEVTDIKEAIRGENVEVIYSTFDETPEHHKRVSEMVIERAKRLVELKQDVTILLDSITRLARAYNLTVPPSGRTLSGGLDPAALHMPKRFFGAARNMREGGSLTILATALVDTGSKMDDVVYEEFKGTGNMELVLDRKLSEKRVFPAIDIPKSGTRREDLLLDREEQEAIYIMRRALNGMKADEAVENIMNMFVHTRDNRELVQRVRRQKFI